MPKRQSGNKKNRQSNFAKLSIFQPNKYKFKKSCPLSIKGAPKIDYKNIKLLKKYISENGKILPSRIRAIWFNLFNRLILSKYQFFLTLIFCQFFLYNYLLFFEFH